MVHAPAGQRQRGVSRPIGGPPRRAVGYPGKSAGKQGPLQHALAEQDAEHRSAALCSAHQSTTLLNSTTASRSAMTLSSQEGAWRTSRTNHALSQACKGRGSNLENHSRGYGSMEQRSNDGASCLWGRPPLLGMHTCVLCYPQPSPGLDGATHTVQFQKQSL